MFKCIFVSVSSVWSWHGCKQKRFNRFGSGCCWDRLSQLKHAWHTEIMRAYYHIKGGDPSFPIYVKPTGKFDDMAHFISNKKNEFVHVSRFRVCPGWRGSAISTADLSWHKGGVDLCGAVINYWSFVCMREWHMLTVRVSPPAPCSPASRRALSQHEVRFGAKEAAYKQKNQLLCDIMKHNGPALAEKRLWMKDL